MAAYTYRKSMPPQEECDSEVSVYRMLERIYKDPPYAMVLGPGCSVAAEATSQVSHMWNLTQLSFGAASPILSNRDRFPKFFRLNLPDHLMNPAKLELMDKFNWQKVATINQAREFFSAVIDDFVKRAEETNFTIISQEIFTNDPYQRIQNLQKLDARIIVTAMYEDTARVLVCAAYRLGFYGPHIIWMFAGWYSTSYWKSGLDGLECTAEQLKLVVEGSFYAKAFFKNPVEERGIANMTCNEFDIMYRKYPDYDPDEEDTAYISYNCYDHIWIAALAFNCTIQALADKGHPKTLDMFTYKDGDINDIIFDCMSNTSLVGVSGRIAFLSGADTSRAVLLQRMQDGERIAVGRYRHENGHDHYEWIEGAIKWKDGIIPRDSKYITYLEIGIPFPLYATMTSLAGLGIILAVSFFAFNVYYRNNRYVKLTSPNINNVLLLGCVLCYSTIFFNTKQTEVATICQARISCFTIGFTLTFGALFTKTWRVYRIFTNRKLLRLKIKDRQLFAVIGILGGVVLVVVVLWESIAPHVVLRKMLVKEIYIAEDSVEVYPFVRVCSSVYAHYFEWTLYIIQGALLSFGAFLAWETRHVRIPAMNDSHQIGLCLYNVVILSSVGLTLSLLLVDQQSITYGVTSGCILIGTTVTQIVIFIPKIQEVLHKGNRTLTSAAHTTDPSRNDSAKIVPTVTGASQQKETPKQGASLPATSLQADTTDSVV